MNYSSHSQGSNGGSTNVPKFEHSASETLASWITNSFACDEHLPAFRTKAAHAKRRIILASLYIGTGRLEQELVDTIYERTKEMADKNKDFLVHILLDHSRGSRGRKNSKTMLLPLVNDFGDNAKVCLYHPPTLRGLLHALVPERFNETISAMHIKAYIFDDTLVMSGANLSNDYFTNRQDRCIVFEDCKELCDYFHGLVETVSSFSLELDPNNTTKVADGFPEHPYKGSKKKYIEAAKEKMQQFLKLCSKEQPQKLSLDYEATNGESCFEDNSAAHDAERRTDAICDSKDYENTNNNESEFQNLNRTTEKGFTDTLVIPTLQMFLYGIRQDESFTSLFFESAPEKSSIFLATAYFNVTSKHWNEILASKCQNFDIVMAHPKANGFYKAPGPAGGIPHAYTLIAKQCYKDIVRFKQQNRLSFWEYQRLGWTFHGKGLWAQLHEVPLPQITMIGSSNFGNRSVYRDLEAQLTIFTKNEQLTSQLQEEKRNITEYCNKVDSNTYKDPERKVPVWVFIIRTFMRTFF
eukprot:gene9166-16833_t